MEKEQVLFTFLKISLMLTNIYLHLFDVYRLFGGTEISILLNEILLSSLLHPEWHGVCVEHDWRRTRYLVIYFFKISLMLTNLYHHLFDVYRLFGGTEISILFE